MGRIARTKQVNGTMSLVEMAFASLGLLFPAWLIWRAISTSRTLERRIANGDDTLLSDDRFSIDRVTLGPPGTRLIEDVQFVAVAPQQHVAMPLNGGDVHQESP